MSETISQIPHATQSNLSDLIPATQGSIGPGTGTTRLLTLALALTPSAATITSPTADPILSTTGSVTNSSGVGSTIFAQTFHETDVTGAAGQAIWANRSRIQFNGGVVTTSASYVTQVIENVLLADRGGASTNAQSWASILSMVDETNHASSVSGLIRTVEIDMEASGLDDYSGGNAGREIVSIVGSPGRNYGGTDTVISAALSINQAGGTGSTFRYKRLINLGGQFNTAGIDLSGATALSNAPSLLLGNDHAISFDGSNIVRMFWDSGNSKLDIQFNGTDIFTLDPSGNLIVTGSLGSTSNNALVLTGQSNGVGASGATLNNSPKVGDPSFWLEIFVNGSQRFLPLWGP